MSIELKHATLEHEAEIFRILAETLGTDYLPSTKEMMYDKDVIALVATFEERIAGFIFGKKIVENGIFQHFPLLRKEGLPIGVNLVGVVDPVGVDATFQRKGIGSALIRGIEDELKGDVDCLVVPAWRYLNNDGSEHINIGKTLENAGFKRHSIVEKYWQHECDNLKSFCPVGPHPKFGCQCSVVFYIKNYDNCV